MFFREWGFQSKILLKYCSGNSAQAKVLAIVSRIAKQAKRLILGWNEGLGTNAQGLPFIKFGVKDQI